MPDANDRHHQSTRLRGFALQLERGELDGDFAEAEVSVAERRALIVQRVRELADKIDE